MLLLFSFVFLAVGFSFLCSIAEAVLLSVSTSYIAALEQEDKPSGVVLRALKEDVNSPLAVILTLNTIAHTVGAAGAGAQAAVVFGSVYVGIFSAVLTMLILVFSEIIPKALGAYYWRQLAPVTAYALRWLVRALYPFVWLSSSITRTLTNEPSLQGFNRKEFAAMAELGEQEGQLHRQESAVLQNLFELREMQVKKVMTPRSVLFSVPEAESVNELLARHNSRRFSRIPIYRDTEDVTGFVMRNDLLEAKSEGRGDEPLRNFRRELIVVLEQTSVLIAFERCISNRNHILLVVNEYGSVQGIVTLEDILETLLGLEITDESDTVADMQALARRLGAMRKRRLGLDEEGEKGE